MDACWDGCTHGVNDAASIECLECIFQGLINVALSVGSLAALVMLILGGFKYLTAGGDPKKAQSAANTLTFAVLGVVLMILAWFILLFIENFTGVNVTVFDI